MRSTLFALLMLPVLAAAQDPWTRGDINRELAYEALLVVDWAQTRYIAAHTDRLHENDVLMFGRAPSIGRVNIVFAAGVIAGPLITHLLPQQYRPYWQWGGIAIEVYCTTNNAVAGVKMEF